MKVALLNISNPVTMSINVESLQLKAKVKKFVGNNLKKNQIETDIFDNSILIKVQN